MSLSYNHLALDVQLGAVTCFVGLLLCEGDVGVHQAASNTDVQTYEVGPRENVISAEHHPYVCHQDVLNAAHNCRC